MPCPRRRGVVLCFLSQEGLGDLHVVQIFGKEHNPGTAYYSSAYWTPIQAAMHTNTLGVACILKVKWPVLNCACSTDTPGFFFFGFGTGV